MPLTCVGSARSTAPGAGGSASSAPTSPASATAAMWRTKSRTEPRGTRRDQSAASSASRERFTRRSAVSGVAAKRRWRRMPTRSISRRTKTSGRIASIAVAAERWSFRKAWIRSRASGRSCGLSSAASSAETMSSFRLRAIVVTRARSAERRSIGGRVRARTTAAASNGSASIRSQARRSRTSALAKNDASPASRNGTLRSSSAAATSLPCRQPEPTTTQIRSGKRLAGGEKRLDLAGGGLRLRPLPVATPEANRAILGLGRAPPAGRESPRPRRSHCGPKRWLLGELGLRRVRPDPVKPLE